MTASQAIRALNEYADDTKAKFFPRFFKCGPGEYGEGDRFLGVTVPQTRLVTRTFRALPRPEIKKLLDSKWHEARLTGLLILVGQFKKADPLEQERIYKFYLANLKRVNNWDLVDTSAPYISGPYLFARYVQSNAGKSEVLSTLKKLAKSKNLWARRVSIISTFYFIRQEEYRPTLLIAEKLLRDEHDLIHKAVGWMLREVGNRSTLHEEAFLNKHAARMPRTMLRYAIEKFPTKLRAKYMAR